VDRIGVIGTSYRTTHMDNLAAATLPAEFGPAELQALARLAGFAELVYLATCNRVEFYFRVEGDNHTRVILSDLRRSLTDLTDGTCELPEQEELYIYRRRHTARHLFQVTAALDSMMVGEAQIAGQVKRAHGISHEAGLLGGMLDQVFHEAFNLSKKVRTKTELARRPVSLVTLVERKMHDHLSATTAPVLIIGAGDMAHQALRLVRDGFPARPVIVANRNLGRAERLVKHDPAAEALSLRAALEDPPAAALLIAVTAAEAPVLESAHVAAVRSGLATAEQLLIIDLAMPPNVAPEAAGLEGVDLVGIEQMRAEAEDNRRLRTAEMAKGEELVDRQMIVLRRRLIDRSLSPAARALAESFRGISTRALEHALARDLAHLSEDDRKALGRTVDDMLKRLVQVPLRGLKGAAWNHSVQVLDSFVTGMEEGHVALDEAGLEEEEE